MPPLTKTDLQIPADGLTCGIVGAKPRKAS